MKPYAFIIALVFCSGCHASSAIKPPIDNRVDECNALYQRVLSITFDKEVDSAHEYSGDKRAYGIHLLDEQFKTSGVSSKFYIFCINKMTQAQIACAKTVATVDSIDTCNQFVE